MNWTRRGCWNGNGAASPHRTGFMSKYRQCHRYSFSDQLMAGSPPLIDRKTVLLMVRKPTL